MTMKSAEQGPMPPSINGTVLGSVAAVWACRPGAKSVVNRNPNDRARVWREASCIIIKDTLWRDLMNMPAHRRVIYDLLVPGTLAVWWCDARYARLDSRGRLSPHVYFALANFGVGLALGVLVTNVHCSGGGAVL